ncbi:MAG: MFS transporter [Tumebacillaceae bacterium]
MKTRIYLYVKALSDLGSMMDQMVLSALIYTETGSNFWLAASLLVRTAGGMLSSLYSGVLADRFDRRKLMIYSDILRAVSIAILIPFPNPTMILLSSFLIGLFSSVFSVSFSAEVPKMYGEENVLETNSFISRLMYISILLGFLGASSADYIGYKKILTFDFFSYLLSAVALMRIRWEQTAVKGNTTATVGKWRQFTDDLREVKSYLKLQPVLLVVFMVYLVETFGAGAHNVGVPILAGMLDPHHVSLYQGLIWSVWAVGSVMITTLLPKWQWVKDRLILCYFISTVFMSAGFITYFSMSTLAAILPFAFLTGVFDASSGTIYSTIMQKSDNHIRGRVFGVSMLVNRGGFAIGFVVVPFLLEVVNLPHMVWIMHGTVITSLLIGITYVYRTNRKALTKAENVSM